MPKKDKTDSEEESQEALSLEQKLFMIDQEIRALHECCLNQGYTPMQVHQFAKPLFSASEGSKKRNWRKWGKFLLQFLVVVGIVTALVHHDPAYRLMSYYARHAFIQVLPFWDWTHLHTDECLIENPYYEKKLAQPDCAMCEDLELIDRVDNVDPAAFEDDFLKRDIPVIVTDGVGNWSAQEKFNVHFLAELYEHEEHLKEFGPCMFVSNVKISSLRALLRKGANMEITNWYAHWENCSKKTAKVIRQFYKRPYFVTPMIELGEPNWIFIARSFKAKKAKLVDIALPMEMFAQLKGTSKVELHPKEPCNHCPELYATLHEGEILVVTDLMWELYYMPLGDPETIAIAAGGFFE